MKNPYPYLIVLFSVFLSPVSVQAATITTAEGDGADTFVDANSAGSNFGTDERARVRGDKASRARKPYLRFDLSSVVASGAAITDGYLILTIQETIDASDFVDPLFLELWSIDDGATGDALADWSETGLTWTNSLTSAQNDGSANGMAGAGTTLLGSIDVSGGVTAGNTLTFDGPDVLTFLQNDTNNLVSFALTYGQDEGTSLGIATKENGTYDAPTLVVIPEASTFALIVGVASFFLIVRRRSRR